MKKIFAPHIATKIALRKSFADQSPSRLLYCSFGVFHDTRIWGHVLLYTLGKENMKMRNEWRAGG
jgi:hypothetical protein